MDRNAVEAVVDREIEGLIHRLGVAHWRIEVRYDLRDDETLGECTRLVNYNKAIVRLNAELLDDDDAVLKTLRHELFHIVLAPFDLFITAAADTVNESTALAAVLDTVKHHAIEKTVINLERMYRGLSHP